MKLSTSTRVGVLGVGRMGLPICRRFTAAGFPVSAYDIDIAARDAASAAGAAVATDPASLAAGSDIFVSVLPGVAELRASFTGPGNPLNHLRDGALWVDLTSGDPTLTDELVAEATTRGVRAVAAPMGGGPTDARDGALAFWLAGPADDTAAARELLGAVTTSDRIRVVGHVPSHAQAVKLLSNLLWFGQVVAVTEALILGERLGMLPGVLAEELSHGAGNSYFLQNHLAPILGGDYSAEFGFDRCVEELQTVRRLAAGASVPMELGELVTTLHEQALARFGPRQSETLAAALLRERGTPPAAG